MPNALILVGGFGTRLRPLTFDFPKPLVPFANQEVLLHQVRALAEVGVKRIVLAVAKAQSGQPNQKELMSAKCTEWEKEFNLTIVFSEEATPLGTAGPIKLAKEELIKDNPDQKMFVLNSDITCQFPLRDLLEFHNERNAQGTILVFQVPDPSRFGVVLSNEDGLITQFIEKPQVFVGDRINAGIYCLNTSVIDNHIVKVGPMSIEREVFPSMAGGGELYAMDLKGHWADIGKPADYLIGLKLFLNSAHVASKLEHHVSNGKYEIIGHVLIADGVEIGEGSVVGPNVTINAGSKVGPCCRISDTALFSNVVIGKGVSIDKSIISNYCKISDWSRLDDCVFGQRVTVKERVQLRKVEAANNISINESAHDMKAWC